MSRLQQAESVLSARSGLVVMGQILGAFGVRGAVRVRSFTQTPEHCFAHGPLLDATGVLLLEPARLTRHSQQNVFVVEPKQTGSREDWQALKGCLLYLRRQDLPPTEPDEYYISDLTGCTLEHKDGRILGEICAVQDFGAGPVLEIAGPDSFMLPLTRELVLQIDLAGRHLLTCCDEDWLPEALQHKDSG